MDEAVTVQLIAVVVVFIATFLSALIPLKVVGTQNGSRQQSAISRSDRILSICNCLAGGVFLTTCFLGLLPSAHRKFDEIQEKLSVNNSYPITEAVILAGFYMILILERIVLAVQEFGCKKDKSYLFEMDQLLPHSTVDHDTSEDEIDLFEMTPVKQQQPALKENGRVGGSLTKRKTARNWDATATHGHSHAQDVDSKNLGRAFVLLIALSVHAVFEGMALGVQENRRNTYYLIGAILIHETLAAFALGSNLVKNGVAPLLLCFYSFVFSMMIPVGIIIGVGIHVSDSITADIASAVTQALAAGVFIFVTFFEIFGHEFDRQQDWLLKVVASLVGFLLLAGLEAVIVFE